MDLYKRVERLLKLIPSRHKLRPIIKDNLSSIAFCPPEGWGLWINEVTINLETYLPHPPQKEWQWKVFELWTEKDRSQFGIEAKNQHTTDKC